MKWLTNEPNDETSEKHVETNFWTDIKSDEHLQSAIGTTGWNQTQTHKSQNKIIILKIN